MLTAEAIVEAADPGRYLDRLRSHAGKMGTHLRHRPRHQGSDGTPPVIQHSEWSDTAGTVTLNWGQWTVQATAGTLTLRAEAADETNLRRIQYMLTTRLENFGRREHITVTWQPPRTPRAAGAEPSQAR